MIEIDLHSPNQDGNHHSGCPTHNSTAKQQIGTLLMHVCSKLLKTFCAVLFTAVFLCAPHTYAVTNVGTSGAQFLKIGPRCPRGQFGRRVWCSCRRCYRHLLESRRTESDRRNEPLRYAYRLARRYAVQLPCLRYAGRKNRHTRSKRDLPLGP